MSNKLDEDGDDGLLSPRGRGKNVRTALEVCNNKWKSWIPSLVLSAVLFLVSPYFILTQRGVVDWTIAIVLVVNAAVLALLAKRETYRFDKRKGKLIITTTKIFGKKITEYWLYEIKDVKVQEYFDPQGGTDFELYLFLRSGNSIKLFSGHIIGVGSHDKIEAYVAISTFLEEFSSRFKTKSRISHSAFRSFLTKKNVENISPLMGRRRSDSTPRPGRKRNASLLRTSLNVGRPRSNSRSASPGAMPHPAMRSSSSSVPSLPSSEGRDSIVVEVDGSAVS